jgi:hypothetical protein
MNKNKIFFFIPNRLSGLSLPHYSSGHARISVQSVPVFLIFVTLKTGRPGLHGTSVIEPSLQVMSTIIRVPVIAVNILIGTVIGKSIEEMSTLIGFLVPTGNADAIINREALGTVLRFVTSISFSLL